MDQSYVYEIRVEGALSDRWSDWFEGLNMRYDPNGQMILFGRLADQSALHGVLIKIRDLGLPLISVQRVGPQELQVE